ncbi:TonB-dependent receptor [Burkholderia sp. Ac-20379]
MRHLEVGLRAGVRAAVPATFAMSLLAIAMNSAFAQQIDSSPASEALSEKTESVDKKAAPKSSKKGRAATSLNRVTVQSARRPNPEVVSRAKQEVALNIISTTTQEEIRKLPDFNAGEAATRLPGVALYVGTGQGRYVYIRGLDSDLSGTTYAGIHLPPTNPVTPQGGGRAFAFDSFPTGMIGSVTVTKTNKPEQDAEALGGTIEIAPKEIPKGKDSFLDYRLGTGVRTARTTALEDISVTGGTRFGFHGTSDKDKSGISSYGDKPFSIIGSLTYFHDQSGTDNWGASYYNQSKYPAAAYSNFTQAYYRFDRTTLGGGAELAYQPDADNRWYARYLHSGYTEDVNRQQLIFKMSGQATQNADGSITSGVGFDKAVRHMQEQVSLDVFQIGGENKFGGGAKLDYNVAYAVGKDYRPYDTSSTFSYRPTGASVTYNNQFDRRYPSYVVQGANQLDPNLYKLSQLTNNTQTYRTQEWSGGSNLTLPTHFFKGATDEQLKFGTSVRFRTTTHTIDPYNSAAVPSLGMGQAITGSPVTFYGDHYANGYNIDPNTMSNLFANGAGNGFKGKSTDGISGLSSGSRDTENVFAVYGQDQMTFGRLGLIGGLRVEATRATYSGYAADKNLTSASPISNSTSYVNFFPSLQARWEFTPDTIGRASYSSTIARPGFNQANPAATIDPSLFVVSQGNPNLKPTVSQNFDLSLERYLDHGGIVSLGLFDKELSNYIVANSNTVMFSPTDPLFGALAGTPSQVLSYKNISHARARGLEFNYDQHYTMLPGILSGLGSSFNWTHVNSSGEIRPGESSSLPSTANDTYNAQLYWENQRFSVRLAGSYIGRMLASIGKSKASDRYWEPRFSLDLGASYALTKHVSVYAAARNLLDTPVAQSEGSNHQLIQRETYGRTYMFGLSGSFD